MELIRSIREMQALARDTARAGQVIGLVPTMGYLHEGHASLMRQLRPQCDRLWVSIFVNPAQFGPSEDLARYPRDLERDLALCRELQVDGVLVPEAAEVYPPDFATWVKPGPVAERYCGASRPGHFQGVLSIVLRLFVWTRCHKAVFGAKDAQQLWLIRRMARDFNLDLVILEGPTIREPDGLALSSRNVYLGPAEREAALGISRALGAGQMMLAEGHPAPMALALMIEMLEQETKLRLDYLHVANWATLDSLAGAPDHPSWRGDELSTPRPGDELVLLCAARVGATRLIDNLRVRFGKLGGA